MYLLDHHFALMKLRSLFIINAIFLGCSGILAIIMPAKVLYIYGVESGPSAELMAQYAGLGSIAIALVSWFIRNVQDPDVQKGILIAFQITYLIGVVVSFLGTVSGMMKLGWVVVGIYLLFALAYAYFLFFLYKK